MSPGSAVVDFNTTTTHDFEPSSTENVDPSILEAFEKDIKDFLLPDNKTTELELKLFDVNEEDEYQLKKSDDDRVANSQLSSSLSSQGLTGITGFLHSNRGSQNTNYSHSNNTSIDTSNNDRSPRYRDGSVSSNNGASDLLDDSRYRSIRSSASSLASNRSEKIHNSLAAKLEQLSHAVSSKDRSSKSFSYNTMSGEGDVTLQPTSNGFNGFHKRSSSYVSGNLSPHSSSPNQYHNPLHQPRSTNTISRISSDLEHRLRKGRQQFSKKKSNATLRLSTLNISGNVNAHNVVSKDSLAFLSPTGSDFSNSGYPGYSRVSDYINFFPELSKVAENQQQQRRRQSQQSQQSKQSKQSKHEQHDVIIAPPKVPEDESALPLWFLHQVLHSNQYPGAHITDHLFIPSDMWSVTKINPKLLATRLKCIDDLTRLGSQFVQGEVSLVTPQFNFTDLEVTFNTAFIIPLNENSSDSTSTSTNNSRSSSIAEGATDYHSPTSVYTTNPMTPTPEQANTLNRFSFEKPKLNSKKSVSTLIGSSLSPTSTAQSKMNGNGFSLTSSVFKRFRKKSIPEVSFPSDTISPTESITMLGPDEAAVRMPVISGPSSPSLTLRNYLTSISNLAACLKSLDESVNQKLTSAMSEHHDNDAQNTDKEYEDEYHPVDIEEQKYAQSWRNNFRSFVSRVACRLILKDIVILQDVYKSDFKGFLLS